MAVFNIPRAGRNRQGYMEKLINNMCSHTDPVFKCGYGICWTSVESIVSSFNMTRNAYCKVNLLKVHSIEIILESYTTKETVILIADRLGCVLYGMGFQSFICAVVDQDGYRIVAAINAVSYVNGSLFYDNNASLGFIYLELLKVLPQEMRLEISDNSFFDPEVMDGNYVHGVFM